MAVRAYIVGRHPLAHGCYLFDGDGVSLRLHHYLWARQHRVFLTRRYHPVIWFYLADWSCLPLRVVVFRWFRRTLCLSIPYAVFTTHSSGHDSAVETDLADHVLPLDSQKAQKPQRFVHHYVPGFHGPSI
ncbi:hypothetical protein D3C80_1417070 [compost metagenome]